MAEPVGSSGPVSPGGGVDHRTPQNAPLAIPQAGGSGAPATPSPAPPPTRLDLGTTVEAIVRTAAPPGTPDAPAVGTYLLLRFVAPPVPASASLLSGLVVESASGETVIATPIGLLVLEQRLALAPGTVIAFERLEETPPADTPEPDPARASGWPVLDEALASLDSCAPALAAQLRPELMPLSGPQLAGTLLFLLGALYSGTWPAPEVARALAAGGHEKLAKRLADDAAELRRLGADSATGPWRVLTLPLLEGAAILPLRLFLRRRPKGMTAPPEEGTRFAVEVELSHLGTLQFDGLLRGQRFDLFVRSHQPLGAELRQDASAIFRRVTAESGLTGEIAFTTAAQFAVTPLTALRPHVEVSV